METRQLITVLDFKDTLNSVLLPLSLNVDEVYYIYHHDMSREFIDDVRDVVLRYKNIKVHFLCVQDDRKEIIEILHRHKDIIVDIGGEKYLSLILFDFAISRGNDIIYYDNEESVIKTYRKHEVLVKDVFKLSIDDVIQLGGGTITQQMHESVRPDDEETIRILNECIESSVHNYSRFTGFVQKVNSLIAKKSLYEGNSYILDEKEALILSSDENYRKYYEIGALELVSKRLMFKTRALAKMFTVSGSFLENYLKLKLKKSGYFDDVKMSCVIDFSNGIRKYPITCEIDCLVIKDNHLLFISCKSNKVDTGDLNEIKVHNVMFGNDLSNPVMCTLDDLDIKNPSVYGKAKELGVAIVDKTDFMRDEVALRFKEIIEGTFNYEIIRE